MKKHRPLHIRIKRSVLIFITLAAVYGLFAGCGIADKYNDFKLGITISAISSIWLFIFLKANPQICN